jgi:hypothetical protein
VVWEWDGEVRNAAEEEHDDIGWSPVLRSTRCRWPRRGTSICCLVSEGTGWARPFPTRTRPARPALVGLDPSVVEQGWGLPVRSG